MSDRWIGKADNEEVLDYIPLLEINKLNGNVLATSRTKSFSSGMRSNSNSGKCVKSKFRTRRYSLNDPEDDGENAKLCVIIQTIEDGTNSGKTTVLRMNTEEEKETWTAKLSASITKAITQREMVSQISDTRPIKS